MMRRVFITAFLLSLVGCDDPPNNTELCRDVYEALCYRADECDTYTYLNECIAHYREECSVMRLHDGVNEPTEDSAQACVDAIGTLDCEGGLDPATLDQCSFLREPPEVSEDAGGDGDVDADVDADADASADDGDVEAGE